MRNIRFVKILCRDCESQSCEKVPLGTWVTEKEGCTKQISAIEGDRYFYYIVEVDWERQMNDAELRKQKEDLMYDIDNRPAGERFK